jgi:hypothetical protein
MSVLVDTPAIFDHGRAVDPLVAGVAERCRPRQTPKSRSFRSNGTVGGIYTCGGVGGRTPDPLDTTQAQAVANARLEHVDSRSQVLGRPARRSGAHCPDANDHSAYLEGSWFGSLEGDEPRAPGTL